MYLLRSSFVAASLLLLASAAHAEIVTFRASGVIDVYANTHQLLPVNPKIGDTFALVYSFDTSVNLSPATSEGYSVWQSPLTAVTLYVGYAVIDVPLDQPAKDYSYLLVGDNNFWSPGLSEDMYTLHAEHTAGSVTATAFFVLHDTASNPTVVDGLDPGQLPDLQKATQNGFAYTVSAPGAPAGYNFFSGSLQSVAPVPLPAGIWLLGSGLAFLGARGRVRRV